MNKLVLRAAIAALCLTLSAGALAAATVSYLNPDKMSDVPRDRSDRVTMEADLLEHFNTLAARLPAGQDLKIEIVDIDLAGEVFPRVAIRDVRVFKGRADWPRIHLRYRVEQDGKVLKEGERQLSDSSYMSGSNRYSSDLFRYEKQLLDDWFRKDLLPQPPQPGG